jgi:hypothetical protein
MPIYKIIVDKMPRQDAMRETENVPLPNRLITRPFYGMSDDSEQILHGN